MNLNSELIQFMKWYKNYVPIGTQKDSVHIVDDYFKHLQNEQTQANGVQASEATAILPRVMPRFSDKKPPVDEVVLFVWWHRNGWKTSQKTLGFIDTANVLHLDFTPAGAKEPDFWCFLNEA